MSSVDCYSDYDYIEDAWNEEEKKGLELLSSYIYLEFMLKEQYEVWIEPSYQPFSKAFHHRQFGIW